MKRSLRALLSGVLDYAGLFPPARLPLRQAIQNYVAYLRDGDGPGWMLGRFICPAAQLPQLDALFTEFGEPMRAGWRLSVLGRATDNEADFKQGALLDFREIRELVGRLSGRMHIDAFETRLPPGVLTAGKPALDRCLTFIDEVWGRLPLQLPREGPSLYLEAPLGHDWRNEISTLAACVSERRRISPHVALKIRTGGVEATQFPAVEQVARFICACRDAGVPFKATAGLHHPLRHHSTEVGTRMHGFINVLTAAILALEARLSAMRLEELLEDGDAAQFSFEDHGLSWREHRASYSQIIDARHRFAVSFGSCSLMEPVDDLRALGWW
jgi:hypothetical protein